MSKPNLFPARATEPPGAKHSMQPSAQAGAVPPDVVDAMGPMTAKEAEREARRLLSRGIISDAQHALVLALVVRKRKNEYKQSRKAQALARRAWLFKTFYGGAGHIVVILLLVISLLLQLVGRTDQVSPMLLVLEWMRWAIPVWWLLSMAINSWYYRDFIVEHKKKERKLRQHNVREKERIRAAKRAMRVGVSR